MVDNAIKNFLSTHIEGENLRALIREEKGEIRQKEIDRDPNRMALVGIARYRLQTMLVPPDQDLSEWGFEHTMSDAECKNALTDSFSDAIQIAMTRNITKARNSLLKKLIPNLPDSPSLA